MYSVVQRQDQQSEPVDIPTLNRWIQELRIGPETRLIEAETGRTVRAKMVRELEQALADQANRTQYRTESAGAGAGLPVWWLAPVAFVAIAAATFAIVRSNRPATTAMPTPKPAAITATPPPTMAATPPSSQTPFPKPITSTLPPISTSVPAPGPASAPSGASSPVLTSVDNAALRVSPKKKAPHVKILATKTPLVILGEQDGYYRVRMPLGTEGWVVKWAVAKPTP